MTITDDEWATRLRDRAVLLAPPVTVDVPRAVVRGRRRRTVRKVAASGVSLAAAAAVVLSVGPVARWAAPVATPTVDETPDRSPSVQRRFADADPTIVTGAAAVATADFCGDGFAPGDDSSGDMGFDAPEMADSRAVVVEQRGPATLAVVEAGDRVAACVEVGSERVSALSSPVPGSVGAGDVGVLLYTSGEAEGLYTAVVVGRYGTDVRSVELRAPGADPVGALLSDGHLVAWWPGNGYDDLEVVATRVDGSTVTVVAPGRHTTG